MRSDDIVVVEGLSTRFGDFLIPIDKNLRPKLSEAQKLPKKPKITQHLENCPKLF